MSASRSTLLSAFRLALILGGLALLPKLSEATETGGEGGCSVNSTHACARLVGVTIGYACSQGTSGGCEDCTSASASDMCFYSDGPAQSGYKPPKQAP